MSHPVDNLPSYSDVNNQKQFENHPQPINNYNNAPPNNDFNHPANNYPQNNNQMPYQPNNQIPYNPNNPGYPNQMPNNPNNPNVVIVQQPYYHPNQGAIYVDGAYVVNHQGQPQYVVVQAHDPRVALNAVSFPSFHVGVAITILILNIFFPGIGTMVLGCLVPKNGCMWVCIGFAQFFLAMFIIGWVWAIIVGVQAVITSHSK
jgi:hypothetical protein